MGATALLLGRLGPLPAAQTNLQQTNALVWVMVGISVAGALITFAFLVYSVWKWRDRETNQRRYG
jgi:heme/copper-type cytochrome/quinol oxidase subunit 2